MEQTELYHTRLETLEMALVGFEVALQQGTDGLSLVMKDLVRNGQLQKFEYCCELLWKVMKHYLFLYEAIDEATLKRVCKAFYQALKVPQEMYEGLISMIDSRNISSHVYSENEFNDILIKLPEHFKIMSQVVYILRRQIRIYDEKDA